MRIVSDAHVVRWRGRMINIHPSLLPKYPGLHTHARALAAGDRVHGASVHFVTPELDGGPAIAQARIPVQPGDDEQALAARVLEREHPLLVASVAAIADGSITLDEHDQVRWNDHALTTPLQLGADDTLLVVAHDAVNRVLLCHVLGIPFARLWSFRQAPTTLNLLEGPDADRLEVVRLNDCSHHTPLFGEAVHRAL